MAGRLWAPSGGRSSWRFLTRFRPATSLRNEVPDLNQLHEVIMSTQSKVTPARRPRKTKAIQTPQPIQLTRERISTQGWNAYHEFVGNLTDAEMRVVGHLLPLTFPSPQAVINEIRRLLGESIAKCKVIPFPVRKQSKSAVEA